jgi:hypothetical protein
MSFNNNGRQQAFPAEPPSFSAGGHEMRDNYYIDSLAPRPNPADAVYLTPYLGMRARLSQTWINRWTVLILLVLIRLMFAIGTTNELIDQARSEALAACLQVEKVAGSVVSLPHYMAQGVNALTAKGIDESVSGLHSLLDLTVTGMEQVVIFYIGMLTNTYLCLITFAVGGSLSAAIGVLENAQGFLDTSLKAIGNDLNGAASTLQTDINSLVSGINTVLGGAAPKVDFSKEINELNSLKLPDTFTADLQKLNSSIPDFAQVKNFTDSLIALPFEEIRSLMDKAWGNFTFNSSLLPVPAKDTVSVCSGNTNKDLDGFFTHLKKIAHNMRNIFLGVLITLAILACIPAALLEMRRWAMLRARAGIIKRFAFDFLDGIYMSSRPFSSDVGRWTAGRFSNSKSQVLARWFIAYCTTLPALLLLAVALAGFISCLFQYTLLKAIEKEVPALAAEIAGAIDDVVGKVNNASTAWATDANSVLADASKFVNDDLLGWVNISTTAVNNTLNQFVDETISVLNTTFYGTPLNTAVLDIFNCLIGIKVQGIEAGLTWLHDHAHVNFPTVPSNSMTLGDLLDKDSDLGSFLSNPSNVTQNDVSSAINVVAVKLAATIRMEALVALGVLFCYFIVVFMGFAWTVYKLFGSDVVRRPDENVEFFAQGASTTPNRPSTSHTVVAEAFNPKSRFSGSPTDPAPAYKTFPDLSSTAPYTLNPHPLPRSSNGDDAFGASDQIQSSNPKRTSFWRMKPSSNPFQTRSHEEYNEKNGF